jgi:WD40 repeat protein
MIAGMVMAVKLVQQSTKQRTMVITGYEGGLTAVHLLSMNDNSSIGIGQLVYLSQPHTQPILSLDVLPDTSTYFTSGADAVIAAHRIPELPSIEDVTDTSTTNGRESATPKPVQSPDTSSDQVSDTVTAVKNTDEPPTDDPPISIPDESTTSSLSFAKRPVAASQTATQQSALKAGGLSSLLSNATTEHISTQPARPPPVPLVQAPFKITNTKHAGQQSLSVRSDGRLLATGGWDTRVRVYSTKTLKEAAVLKWHKEGIYAVDFGEILEAEDLRRGAGGDNDEEQGGDVAKRETGLSRLQRQREEKMQVKHWIAAGAKDGKVSLWEVF